MFSLLAHASVLILILCGLQAIGAAQTVVIFEPPKQPAPAPPNPSPAASPSRNIQWSTLPDGTRRALIDFTAEPADNILPGPETGIPSDQGNCIGSGCANGARFCVGTGCSQAANGEAAGMDAIEEGNEASQFPAPSEDPPTRFQNGTLAFGPTWADGGFVGGSINTFLPNKYGDPYTAYTQELAMAPLMVTPDAFFPREQNFIDLTLLSASILAVNGNQVFKKVPQVSPVLPPSTQEFTDVANLLFDRFSGPIKQMYKTDWDTWQKNLIEKTVPDLQKTATARDFELSTFYLDVTGNMVDQLRSSVEARAKGLLEESTAGVGVDRMVSNNRDSMAASVKDAIAHATTFFRSPISAPPKLKGLTTLREQQTVLEDSFSRLQPVTLQQERATLSGNIALSSAKRYLDEQRLGEADIAQRVAYSLLTIAVSLTPILGPARAGYEFLTGMDLLTGEQLSREQRIGSGVGFALGFATFGIATLATVRIIDEMVGPVTQALSAGMAEKVDTPFEPIETNGYPQFPLSKLDVPLKIERIETAPDVNSRSLREIQKFYHGFPSRLSPAQAPWDQSSLIIEGVTQEPVGLVRMSGSESVAGGRFCALKVDVEGLSPSQMAAKFNLPKEPAYLVEVEIPAGSLIRTGPVGPNRFGSSTGARQIELLDKPLQDKWITKAPQRLRP